MHCPFCANTQTRVLDSRSVAGGKSVRRRRKCLAAECGKRFTTFETMELFMPLVVKNNGTRQVFSEAKLRSGMQKALAKSPVVQKDLDSSVARIMQKAQSLSRRQIKSGSLAELALDELQSLDPLACLRFASVYRRFTDMNALLAEAARLASGNKKGAENSSAAGS